MATKRKAKRKPRINGTLADKYKRYSGGRPGINFDVLFAEWLKSDQPRAVFLRERGLDPTAQHVKKQTQQWTAQVRQAHANMSGQTMVDRPKPSDQKADLWQMVQQWRRAQAKKDYDTANVLRDHVALILNNSSYMIVDSESGEQRLGSKLSPTQIRMLAKALESIQRIQRLALGMSTENIGVEPPVKDEVPTDKPEDDGVPTFEVQISSSGKFKTVKPRQIS